MTAPKNNGLIKLNDVRLSYPSLFNMTSYPGSQSKPGYSATFILDKVQHAKEIKEIQSRIEEVLAEKNISKNKIQQAHNCLKDGDLSDKEEYQNSFILKSKNTNRFPIVNKDGLSPVIESDNLFYGGCYVSAYVSIYLYQNKAATGIGANLKSIQFRKDGEPFGEAPQDITNAFEPVEDLM